MPGDPTQRLLTALRALAPPQVSVGVRLIGEWPMFEVERVQVAAAAPRRRREFATGRALLRDLIGVDLAIPVGRDRAPILPAGVCGSLAHDERFVVAAVGSRRDFRSIGVDVEPVDPLDHDMAAVILRADEAGLDAHLAFTLKEAAYKAWSGLGGGMLEHHDVRLRIVGSHFQAEVVATGATLDGSFATAGGRWLALVAVTGPGPGPE